MSLLLILILIAIIPWSIPLLRGTRTSSLVMGVLLLGTVFGPAFFAVDGVIQISLDRILWGAVMGVVAFRIVRGELRLPIVSRIDVILVGFVTVALISCIRFGMFGEGQPPIARWLFFLAIPMSLYFAMRSTTITAIDVQRIVTALIILGVYLAFTGVMEMTDRRALVFPRFINDPTVWEFFGRGRGPLLNPAGNGIVLTLALTASATRFVDGNRYQKAWYGLLSIVILAGCYSTLTRSVWMGAAGAIGLIGLLSVPLRIRILALAGVVLLGGVMATGLKDQLLSLKRDKALSAAEAAKSIELRPLLALVAYEMFLDRPLGGHGYGHYFDAAEPYHAIRRHQVPLENVRPYVQHNVFLSVLVDLGLIGFCMHLLLIVSWFALAWQMASQKIMTDQNSHHRILAILMLGLIMAYVCNGMFHEVGIIEMMHMYLFVFAGALVTLRQSNHATANAVSPDAISRGLAPDRRGDHDAHPLQNQPVV